MLLQLILLFLPVSVSSLELNYSRRAVSTTESRPWNLPPIANNTRPGNRKARVKATTHAKDRESWANNWANVRAQQTNVYANGSSANSLSKDTLARTTTPGAQSVRKNIHVVPMNEKEAVLFKRLKGIYANSTEKFVRVQRLQSSINALQSRTLHSEIECSLKEYKKKIDNDKCSRSELKRVRDRYYKEKERRKKHSHVSLSALECPQVSRHAYGLPEEGQELGASNVTQTARKQLFDIWQRATKRAANVSKFLHGRNEEKASLPEIKVRSKPRRFKTSREGAQLFVLKGTKPVIFEGYP